MTDVTNVESGAQHIPEIKYAVPFHMDKPDLTDEQRKARQVRYVIEDLDSEAPYLETLKNESLLIGVLNGNFVVYSHQAQSHSVLRRAEGIDPSADGMPQFQIDAVSSGPDISIHGNQEQVTKMVKFFRKSGFPADSHVHGSITTGKKPDAFSGTLDNPGFNL